MSKIKVFIKNPGECIRAEEIENTLESLQKIVRGHIEVVTISPDMALICNEEGRLLDMPYNCRLFNQEFVGPVIFVGVNEYDFCDIPTNLETMKMLFPDAFADGEAEEAHV